MECILENKLKNKDAI